MKNEETKKKKAQRETNTIILIKVGVMKKSKNLTNKVRVKETAIKVVINPDFFKCCLISLKIFLSIFGWLYLPDLSSTEICSKIRIEKFGSFPCQHTSKYTIL